jgi:hypothetical protein
MLHYVSEIEWAIEPFVVMHFQKKAIHDVLIFVEIRKVKL